VCARGGTGCNFAREKEREREVTIGLKMRRTVTPPLKRDRSVHLTYRKRERETNPLHLT
jgi:hypothetical protein